MTKPSGPAKPDDFTAEALAFALRWWRENVRQISLRAAGEALPMSHSHLSKLERNERSVPPDLIPQLDRLYGADGRIAAFYSMIKQIDRRDLGTLATVPSVPVEEDETERRRLLQIAAAGMSAGAFGGTDEPVRRLVELAVNGAHRSVEDWELACADHLHAINTLPARQVHDDLLVDLLGIQQQLHNTPKADQTELQRITAVLAAFHASVLTRLSERGAALRWYQTARAASDASGDLDLRIRIRAHEAGHSLYGLRDPKTVLRLTADVKQFLGPDPRPSVGLVSVLLAEAHALALLGRGDEARQAVRVSTDLAATNLPVIPGFWEPSDYRMYFNQSRVYSAVGDQKAASRAQEHILRGHPDGYQVQINTRLHAAQCTVVNGGIDEGVRQAATVIDALPRAYRNVMIIETGRNVLRAVPFDQRKRPAVSEFREVLAIEAPQDV
ncbi:helix-turn-helix transcriptional regulator [Thermopolyspora sp. NPDC052614]|uniref:helix-turn-helix domain-containing protein n=1 Tax=Thermopolyspora sp. NPDC052614 TaxID=3155682 RepID=UPI00341697F6